MTAAMSASSMGRYSTRDVGWVNGDSMAVRSSAVTIPESRSGRGALGGLGTSMGSPFWASSSDIWPLCTIWAAMRPPWRCTRSARSSSPGR